jgi:uncharacterized membrane protein YfhO
MPLDGSANVPEKAPARRELLRTEIAGIAACAALLIACEALVFWWLAKYGVSSVWEFDGLSQHFSALYYCREAVLAFLRDPLHGFEMWTWRLGFGADVLATMSYYLADPFALISLIFPVRSLEAVYAGLYFLRVLLAGLAGYAYLREMRASRYASIIGALIYTFATYALFSMRHPWFMNAMVWFPLILLGIEYALRKRRWWVLAGAVALLAGSNFYYFYQVSIIAVIYAVLRFVEVTPAGGRVRKLGRTLLDVGGTYALGATLAGIVLIPVFLGTMASSRAAGLQATGLLADLATYRSYLVALATPFGSANSAFCGFSILSFLLLPVLFMRRKRHTTLKVMLVLFPLSLVFPFVGKVFNGFDFPSYRFLFMWGLFLAAAVAALLTEGRTFTRREFSAMGASLLTYGVLAGFGAGRSLRLDLAVAATFCLGAAYLGVFALEARRARRGVAASVADAETQPSRRIFRGAVVLLLVIGIAGAGAETYWKRFDPRLTQYVKAGTVLDRFTGNAGMEAAALPGAAVARVDNQDLVHGSDLGFSESNDQLVQGYNGVSFYFSLMDDRVLEYLKGLQDRPIRLGFDFAGLDDRAALETLNGVRYYLASGKGTQYVPYGFVATSTIGATTVFENRNALPIGYVYHSAVSADAYAALPPLEKQQALLQRVVLADGVASGVPRSAAAPEVVEVPFSAVASGAAIFDPASRVLKTKRKNTGLDLTFAPVVDSELYVDLTGIDPRPVGTDYLRVTARTAGPAKSESLRGRKSGYYFGNDETLINLGYFATSPGSLTLRFDKVMTLHYADLKVYAVPMGSFSQHVDALRAEGMRDVRIGTDSISGSVTSKGSGLLFLSVPFSTGWKATVDGVPTPLVRANVGFTGIPVSDGAHVIELRYSTPGLALGAALSLFAVVVLGVLWSLRRRRARADAATASTEAAPTRGE